LKLKIICKKIPFVHQILAVNYESDFFVQFQFCNQGLDVTSDEFHVFHQLYTSLQVQFL